MAEHGLYILPGHEALYVTSGIRREVDENCDILG